MMNFSISLFASFCFILCMFAFLSLVEQYHITISQIFDYQEGFKHVADAYFRKPDFL